MTSTKTAAPRPAATAALKIIILVKRILASSCVADYDSCRRCVKTTTVTADPLEPRGWMCRRIRSHRRAVANNSGVLAAFEQAHLRAVAAFELIFPARARR